MIDIYSVIQRPLISEKGTEQKEKDNKITFVVHPNANKIEIKRAVEKLLEVKVAKVNLMNITGKKKRLGRFEGRRKNIKKAVVTLKEGEKLEIFEGV